MPTGRIQSPSCRWIVPVGPYLWKVHLAICVIVMSSSSATLTLTNITTATMVHCCQGQQQEHHLWEDHGHGISSFFKFLLHHSPNLSALMIVRETITNLAKFMIFIFGVDKADYDYDYDDYYITSVCGELSPQEEINKVDLRVVRLFNSFS